MICRIMYSELQKYLLEKSLMEMKWLKLTVLYSRLFHNTLLLVQLKLCMKIPFKTSTFYIYTSGIKKKKYSSASSSRLKEKLIYLYLMYTHQHMKHHLLITVITMWRRISRYIICWRKIISLFFHNIIPNPSHHLLGFYLPHQRVSSYMYECT